MNGVAIGLLFVAVGAVIRAPGLIAVGVVVGLVWAVRVMWTRYGLRQLTYERRLDATRASIGDEIGLELIVRNRKLLPVPWLAVDDLLTSQATIVDRALGPADVPGFGALRTTWTLGWFERVTRRLRIRAELRGVYEFREARLEVADLFARGFVTSEDEHPVRYRVVPRSVPVRTSAPLSLLPGPARTIRGLFEDPSLFAGVRPYAPGDPFRRIHWKASGRLGTPVSRRYDPSHERELVIALDAQTVPGPFWLMQYEEDLVEELCTAAMSLARSAVDQGIACGLSANGYALAGRTVIHLAPSAAHGQVERVADELASLSRWASMPFTSLLGQLGRRLRPSTIILACSGRMPDDFLPVMRRLAASGHPVRLMAMGATATEAARHARAVGIPAEIGRLAPDWRSADALELVG